MCFEILYDMLLIHKFKKKRGSIKTVTVNLSVVNSVIKSKLFFYRKDKIIYLTEVARCIFFCLENLCKMFVLFKRFA